MDKFIEAIVNADHAAGERVDALKKQRLQLQSQAEANRDEVYKKLMEEEKLEIEKQQAAIKQTIKEQLAENEQRYEQSVISLQKVYDENREQWIDTIVDACLHA